MDQCRWLEWHDVVYIGEKNLPAAQTSIQRTEMDVASFPLLRSQAPVYSCCYHLTIFGPHARAVPGPSVYGVSSPNPLHMLRGPVARRGRRPTTQKANLNEAPISSHPKRAPVASAGPVRGQIWRGGVCTSTYTRVQRRAEFAVLLAGLLGSHFFLGVVSMRDTRPLDIKTCTNRFLGAIPSGTRRGDITPSAEQLAAAPGVRIRRGPDLVLRLCRALKSWRPGFSAGGEKGVGDARSRRRLESCELADLFGCCSLPQPHGQVATTECRLFFFGPRRSSDRWHVHSVAGPLMTQV